MLQQSPRAIRALFVVASAPTWADRPLTSCFNVVPGAISLGPVAIRQGRGGTGGAGLSAVCSSDYSSSSVSGNSAGGTPPLGPAGRPATW